MVSTDGTFLAYAVLWAAVLSLPFGVAQAGGRLLEPRVLAAGFGIALLSAVLPYTLDMAALRRLPSRIVAVLESLEPAVGGLAAVALLEELLTGLQWGGVACVVIASIGTFLVPARSAKGKAHSAPHRRQEPEPKPDRGEGIVHAAESGARAVRR
ncbi:EamA family transporter [Streptomyces sp. NPDC091272]|uniref:EamA family transporter n=1 Tax=Streptomyces sp. NPDC091272 TaxID=3365981 RepID=UPI0037FF8FFB